MPQNNENKPFHNTGGNPVPNSSSSQNVLKARRGVIRMLIIVVLTFALCNLPFHARKMWQYWSHNYHGDTNFSALFTPLTFLVTYFNSGINPLLYAFLSKNFRRWVADEIVGTLTNILLVNCIVLQRDAWNAFLHAPRKQKGTKPKATACCWLSSKARLNEIDHEGTNHNYSYYN